MPISVACTSCGQRIKAPDKLLGRTISCPACGSAVKVEGQAAVPAAPPYAAVPPAPPPPTPDALRMPPDDDLQLAPVDDAPPAPPAYAVPPAPAAPGPAGAARARTAAAPRTQVFGGTPERTWNRRYAFLALALIPLLVSTVIPGDDDTEQRLRETLEHNPEVLVHVMAQGQEADEAQVFNMLPGHRIEGAHLPKDSWAHWFYAALSAAAFMGLMLALFPLGHDGSGPLLTAGIFTGTAGILLLLAFQFVAFHTNGVWIRGGGVVALLFLLVKLIGFSYMAAMSADTGWLLSSLGFICGVGFCEEVCKALPVVWHYRTFGTLTWRKACLIGMASGVGFGVSEGITYSSDFYNGVSTGNIYVIRFVSCVALHAMWAAANGASIHRNRYLIQGGMSFWELLWGLVRIMFVPMVLHGLYDTMLKKEHEGWALIMALLSFAWLAYQIERSRREDEEAAAALPPDAPGLAPA
ncbi:MAG: PrsW family glutamic-type intramembrane protease [Planctomycetes bacterium]|nr:PrsW family glutamic-type intramembrane protease [Planctomycetota bacterium]